MHKITEKGTDFFDTSHSLAPLFIRLMTGFHLVYVTRNAAFNSDSMHEVVDFFDTQKIPLAYFLAPLAVYAEFICGFLFIAGLFTRFAAAIMIIVFIFAISIVHIGKGYTNAFSAIVMLAGSLSLLFSGAGEFSLDKFLKKRKLAKEVIVPKSEKN